MGISDITSRPLEGVGISSWLPGVPSCSNSEKGFGVNGRRGRFEEEKRAEKKSFFPCALNLEFRQRL